MNLLEPLPCPWGLASGAAALDKSAEKPSYIGLCHWLLNLALHILCCMNPGNRFRGFLMGQGESRLLHGFPITLALPLFCPEVPRKEWPCPVRTKEGAKTGQAQKFPRHQFNVLSYLRRYILPCELTRSLYSVAPSFNVPDALVP